tara:strand:- start:13 stop:135 length:123 start_codon:yes stop_codon:yes gene_type:complete
LLGALVAREASRGFEGKLTVIVVAIGAIQVWLAAIAAWIV